MLAILHAMQPAAFIGLLVSDDNFRDISEKRTLSLDFMMITGMRRSLKECSHHSSHLISSHMTLYHVISLQ